jgi:hypothetical protein
MEFMPVQLTAIHKFKQSLTDFRNRPIYFIKEEDDWILASVLEEIRWIIGGGIPFDYGQSHKIAFRHLRRTTLDNGQAKLLRKLVNYLGFSDTMATAKKDGKPCLGYSRSQLNKRLGQISSLISRINT